MMSAADWRRDEAYEHLDTLDPSALAWEFLRRNPRYRAAYRAGDPVAPFGLRFPIDPDLSAAEAEPIWLTEVAPAIAVRMVAAAPSDVTSSGLAAAAARRRLADDGLHLRFPNGLQARVPLLADGRESLGALVPLDRHLLRRLAAVRALRSGLAGRWRDLDLLSRARRRRLARALRAGDARSEGASYREIAERVLGERFADSLAWRTSSARAVAIRLCAAAHELAGGGYLRLLAGR